MSLSDVTRLRNDIIMPVSFGTSRLADSDPARSSYCLRLQTWRWTLEYLIVF
jgi:hypothetical protein